MRRAGVLRLLLGEDVLLAQERGGVVDEKLGRLAGILDHDAVDDEPFLGLRLMVSGILLLSLASGRSRPRG